MQLLRVTVITKMAKDSNSTLLAPLIFVTLAGLIYYIMFSTHDDAGDFWFQTWRQD